MIQFLTDVSAAPVPSSFERVLDFGFLVWKSGLGVGLAVSFVG